MTATETRIERPRQLSLATSGIDLLFAGLSLALYAFWVLHFRYRGTLGGDEDVYSVLDGLMDGARTGTWFASPFHYGSGFSFGYIFAIYRFVGREVLDSPQRLIALINAIGGIAAISGALFLWLFTSLLYGLRVATVSVTLFALSPMMLELGTTGHQMLPAFALFAAAAVMLFLPVRGLSFVCSSIFGALLLVAALVTRAEVILAFPFLVLARVDLRSTRRFFESAALRAVAPGLAAAVFFLLKHHYVDRGSTGQLGAFLGDYYKLSNIPRGIIVYLLGCGFVASIAGLVAVVHLYRAVVEAPKRSDRRQALLLSAIGPLALLLPNLLFWIENPLPVRHFLLCLAGMAILIGLMLEAVLPGRAVLVYASALIIVLTNQVSASLLGPFVLKHYPSNFKTIPGFSRSVPMRVMIGSSLDYHRKVVAQLAVTDAFAEKVLSACDNKTLIVTSREKQLFSHLYEIPTPWEVRRTPWRGTVLKSAQSGAHTILVTEEGDWPKDTAVELMDDPDLQAYKIIRDPGSLSVYDNAAIPANRLAHFGCAVLHP